MNKKLFIVTCVIFTLFLLSGCATIINTQPDYVMCPKCNNIYEADLFSQESTRVQCYYCDFEFDRAEGKRLFNKHYARINSSSLRAETQQRAVTAQRNVMANQTLFNEQQNIQSRMIYQPPSSRVSSSSTTFGVREELKYNPFNKQWSYENPDASPRYNPFSGKWEMSAPNDQLKYNSFTGTWSYGNPAASPRYNAFTGDWE